MTIAGIELEIRAPQGPIESVLADRYSPFLGAVCEPVCSIRFEPNGAPMGQVNSPMAVLHGAGDDEVAIEHVDFEAKLDLDGSGVVHTAADRYTIDHFLRLVMALLAPRHDALMLQACGVVSGGGGHVFTGPAGSGKSTLAALARHRPVLSDQHVIVRRVGGSWCASSTPFWGSSGKSDAARSAPLVALWSLKRWPAIEIERMDAVSSLREVLENAVLPGPAPALKTALFDTAADLAASVPAAELRFTPVDEVWEAVDAGTPT